MSSAKGATGTRRPLVGGNLSRSLAAAAKQPQGLAGPSTSPAAWLPAGYRLPRRRVADVATAWTRRLRNDWSVTSKWPFSTVGDILFGRSHLPVARISSSITCAIPVTRSWNHRAQPHQPIGKFVLPHSRDAAVNPHGKRGHVGVELISEVRVRS
jgi:hypothetical protein